MSDKMVKAVIPHRGRTQWGVKYSRVEVLDLKKLFDEHDLDHDGKVTPQELYKSLASNKHFTGGGREAFKVVDQNIDGILSFHEYLKISFPKASAAELKTMRSWAYPSKEDPLTATYKLTSEQLNDIHMLFNLYDKDRSGRIDRKELVTAACTSGYTEEEAEALFTSADKNLDDYITFDEFQDLMSVSFIG